MKKESLREAIAREEAQLAELAHKQDESRKRLAALKEELAAVASLENQAQKLTFFTLSGGSIFDADGGLNFNAALHKNRQIPLLERSNPSFMLL